MVFVLGATFATAGSMSSAGLAGSSNRSLWTNGRSWGTLGVSAPRQFERVAERKRGWLEVLSIDVTTAVTALVI